MAAPTAAELAAKLKGDNRTVVGSKSPTNPANDFVATDVGPEGADYGLANASTASAAAYEDGVTRGAGEVVVPQGSFDGSDLSKNALRTMFFHLARGASYDPTKVGFGAKRCFVNAQNQPLAADGTPAATVEAAVDAETTDLSSLGEAVTNWAQTSVSVGRTPPPGTYTANERQTSLYAPYAGWTAQDALT